MEYTVIEDFNESQLQELHSLFKNEWWTQQRALSEVKELLSNSGVTIGVVDNETTELVGFARAITDSLYRAIIFDVITKQPYRNSGIGSLLINSLLSHSKIVNVERVELYCPERLIPYYEKFGFSTDVNGSVLMRLKI